jgi:putative membrane protein
MQLRENIGIFLKGLGMGAANVIPGVSGGTIALITGIYPRIIQALRHASQPDTLKGLLTGSFKKSWQHMDGGFLVVLGLGVVFSILTLARGFDFLLENYEIPTMAFFFGLVAISVPQVGQTVERWNATTLISLVVGTAIAVALAFVAPSEPNAGFLYLIVCGVAAICSMVLPGLSGSFVLMLMGNYVLVIRAIKEFDFAVIVPMGIGCAVGLLGFVQILGWALKKAPNTVISLMTGFVLGSLLTIWPWKVVHFREVEIAGEPKLVPTGYSWELPSSYGTEFFLAVALMIGGAVFLHFAHKASKETAENSEAARKA